ncbi:5-deoxy-glucuronate isomerase [Lichenifustis flavocetrariae]|uniref:5-deoxy-glucuronate isomerase n=1 Tax=Lichenifustis flavocetrariae TaxID=2949735 RepID=A0AA42CM10_9HYPH|nr:5-deoxy-glucuronate isomerase [Lichenifustis flavocetrariae]MCW6507880.1 5-deoxy-glucuronate isomerase [Lichenifustis flavocetrariae]
MAPSPLLVHPQRPDTDNRIHHVTPESAGWTYVGFEVFDLADGQKLERPTGDQEICLVIVSGKAHVTGGGRDFGVIGERLSVFEGLPWSVYVPAKADWTVVAQGPCELAVCAAPGTGRYPARLIGPEQVGTLTRGKGSNVRHVRNILPEEAEAESLLVVEVITPPGNWSSYPPHKHDQDNLPAESLLEETYYHRLNPPQGYGMQRVYTDDRSLDESISFADRDVVLVPRGYHPCAAPHGYTLYYLNVMAGPTRIWRFHNDPAHEWMLA